MYNYDPKIHPKAQVPGIRKIYLGLQDKAHICTPIRMAQNDYSF